MVARKVSVSPEVDWDYLASATEGYSGADLQAVVYNAHLEAIHSNLNDHKETMSGDGVYDERNKSLDYTILGGGHASAVVSRAEKEALEKRVRIVLILLA